MIDLRIFRFVSSPSSIIPACTLSLSNDNISILIQSCPKRIYELFLRLPFVDHSCRVVFDEDLHPWSVIVAKSFALQGATWCSVRWVSSELRICICQYTRLFVIDSLTARTRKYVYGYSRRHFPPIVSNLPFSSIYIEWCFVMISAWQRRLWFLILLWWWLLKWCGSVVSAWINNI